MFMQQVPLPNPQEIAIDFSIQMEILFGEMQHRAEAMCMYLAEIQAISTNFYLCWNCTSDPF